jgi:hypothetical protein
LFSMHRYGNRGDDSKSWGILMRSNHSAKGLMLAAIVAFGYGVFRTHVSAGQQVRCWESGSTTTTTCRIDEPNVKQPRTEYPQISLTEGSIVRVNAAGCVQTGGIGQTWKRYVDPRGPDADHLYHGLIWFPGLPVAWDSVETDGRIPLLRLSEVIGRSVTVHTACPPRADCRSAAPGSVQGHLTLGYEDNDYHDNGYWQHDDGDGQCRGVGPAFVELVIERPRPPVYGRPPDVSVPPTGTPRENEPLNCDNLDGAPAVVSMLCREFREELLSSGLSAYLPDAGSRPTGSQITWRTDRGTAVTIHISSDVYTQPIAKLGDTACRQLVFSRPVNDRQMYVAGTVCMSPAGSWSVWSVR